MTVNPFMVAGVSASAALLSTAYYNDVQPFKMAEMLMPKLNLAEAAETETDPYARSRAKEPL